VIAAATAAAAVVVAAVAAVAAAVIAGNPGTLERKARVSLLESAGFVVSG
jgi:hypothetical protein